MAANESSSKTQQAQPAQPKQQEQQGSPPTSNDSKFLDLKSMKDALDAIDSHGDNTSQHQSRIDQARRETQAPHEHEVKGSGSWTSK